MNTWRFSIKHLIISVGSISIAAHNGFSDLHLLTNRYTLLTNRHTLLTNTDTTDSCSTGCHFNVTEPNAEVL